MAVSNYLSSHDLQVFFLTYFNACWWPCGEFSKCETLLVNCLLMCFSLFLNIGHGRVLPTLPDTEEEGEKIVL